MPDKPSKYNRTFTDKPLMRKKLSSVVSSISHGQCYNNPLAGDRNLPMCSPICRRRNVPMYSPSGRRQNKPIISVNMSTCASVTPTSGDRKS
ncbi:hypothetical protein SLEP1_g3647 [Rubroshorea leprosula]|uniref:Uncharacterized protein n=1 Tax=Rubroshorea leprosula TaxID=152421 RepID=A0AAV5HTQ1_9ROSI|nr:hypothetical protein SLEP1_g3647 [Rubroshorea leprosula]